MERAWSDWRKRETEDGRERYVRPEWNGRGGRGYRMMEKGGGEKLEMLRKAGCAWYIFWTFWYCNLLGLNHIN